MNDRIPRRLFTGSGAALLGFAGRACVGNPHSAAEFTKINEPDFYEFTMSSHGIENFNRDVEADRRRAGTG